MPDVSGQRVLLFTDSLGAGQFSPGAVMATKLKGAAAVKVDSRVGRSARNFYDREDHAAHLAAARAFAPDLTIVILGTNAIGMSAKVERAAMIKLRDQLPGEVWAFGPPAFPAGALREGSPAVASMMLDVFGRHFIDWRLTTMDLTTSAHRTSDGVHFNATGGKVAGERMAETFIKASDSMVGMGVALSLAVGVAAYFLLR